MAHLPNLRVHPPKHPIRSSKTAEKSPTSKDTIIYCGLYIDGEHISGDYTYEQALKKVRSLGKGFVWLGLHEPKADYMNAVAHVFGLHPLVVEDALEAHQRPKLEQYDDTLFLVLKTLKYAPHASSLTHDVTDTNELMIIAGKDYLITVRYGGYNIVPGVRKRLEETGKKQLQLGPIGVMHAIADTVVDSYLELTSILETEVERTEQEIFSPGGKVSIDHIYLLKRDVLEQRRAIVPLAIALQRLTSDELTIIPEEVRRYFYDVLDHHTIAAEEIASFDEVLNTLIDAALAKVGIQQNTDMRKISAWAAIASLPTMIAGIYGMNFDEMPELHWKYGYGLILTALVTSCFMLWRKFRKKGWL